MREDTYKWTTFCEPVHKCPPPRAPRHLLRSPQPTTHNLECYNGWTNVRWRHKKIWPFTGSQILLKERYSISFELFSKQSKFSKYHMPVQLHSNTCSIVPCPARVGMNMTKCRFSGFPSLYIYKHNSSDIFKKGNKWHPDVTGLADVKRIQSVKTHLHESTSQPSTEHRPNPLVESLLPCSLWI